MIDEDDIAQAIDDTLGPGWTSMDAARAIMRLLREKMMEPTHEMVCAGDGKDPGFGSLSGEIWRTMIKAALK